MADPTDDPIPVPPDAAPADAAPQPLVQPRNRLRLSLVWLVPLLALAVGIGLAVRHVLQTGPQIVIEFRTAEGLEAGRTEVRYKEVAVGKVTRVALSRDRERVLVTVQLSADAANMAVKDSRFWVVRPRIGTAGVSGLNTLLSGAYIGVDAGESDERQRRFVGLEQPPFVLRNEPGRSFVLTARNLGSLDIGSPVYYRRIRVGRVVGYNLDPKMDLLSVQVFIESPNERLVTTQTRFWNASGIDVSLNAGGLTLNTQSLASVIAGGVAFGTPADAPQPAPAAEEGTRFTLFPDRRRALAPPDGPPMRVRMVFAQNARGLSVGAPVEVLGVEVGQVTGIRLQPAAKGTGFAVEVLAELFPRRLGLLGRAGLPSDEAQLMQALVAHGMRAQMRYGNLVTAQMLVALDFPRTPPKPAGLDLHTQPPTLPTIPNQLGDLQPQLMQVVRRLSQVRFDQIGQNLEQTLAAANAAIRQLTPEARATLGDVQKTLEQAERTLHSAQTSLDHIDQSVASPDAPLQRNANETLAELQRAAQSLRVLADYLQRHPDALLRGQRADAPLDATTPP
jgi:paraquat-inducible protein B